MAASDEQLVLAAEPVSCHACGKLSNYMTCESCGAELDQTVLNERDEARNEAARAKSRAASAVREAQLKRAMGKAVELDLPEVLADPLRIFPRVLWERIHRHKKNCVVVITGESGSGKSWSGLRLCELVDDKFGKDDVFFKPHDLVKSAAANKRRGRSMMLDEAGVGAHNRNWQDEVNKSLIYLLQTWRVMGQALFITAPYPSFIDNQVWKQCQYWVEMNPLQTGVAVVKRVQPREDLKGRPIHYPFLKVPLLDGRIVKAPTHIFSPPNARMARWYEGAAWDFKQELLGDLDAGFQEKEKSEDRNAFLRKKADEVIKRMKSDPTYLRKTQKNGRVKLDLHLLPMETDLNTSEVKSVAALINKAFAW